METLRKKYIGTREFYRYALALAVPMIIQNLVTNFVSLLDNIMVGQIGTAQMSAVSIVNQLLFVFNLTLFGGMSGASIFGTQFFGKGDHTGQKYTFRFRLWLALGTVAAGLLILGFFDTPLISLFLSSDDSPELVAETLGYARQYLRIMLWSLLPFGLSQAYVSVEREIGETRIPMIASISAIGINLFFNYCLIFGKCGFPKLGVEGAAIATVLAKAVECLVVVVWAHTHPARNKYIIGLFQGFTIPAPLAKDILIRGCPLLINEFLWSLGMSFIAQCFSVRGLDVVAARNISNTLYTLGNCVYILMGNALGIIVGAKLGAGDKKAARDIDNKMMVFCVFVSLLVTVCMLPLAYLFPRFYNTEDSIRTLATSFIIIQTLSMPLCSFTNACYFTLRCGGKTGLTFAFDFISTWCVMLPLAFILSRFTNLEIHALFAVVTFSEIGKCLLGYFLIRSDIWINTIVD